PGRQIDRRRSGSRHADRRLLRQPAIGLRRERRRLLVADVDHADAFLDHAAFGQEHRPAHDKKAVLYAFHPKAAGEDFRTGELSHCGNLQKERPAFAGRFVVASGQLLPMTLSPLSDWMSPWLIPSHCANTSSVCWPSLGEGRSSGGLPSKRTGQVSHWKSPSGCFITCMMPRSRNDLSFCSSSVSCTAPAGTPAAPMICIASSLVWLFVHSAMTSLMNPSFLLRSSLVAKRASPIRSSRPITFSSRSQCSGLARLQKM